MLHIAPFAERQNSQGTVPNAKLFTEQRLDGTGLYEDVSKRRLLRSKPVAGNGGHPNCPMLGAAGITFKAGVATLMTPEERESPAALKANSRLLNMVSHSTKCPV